MKVLRIIRSMNPAQGGVVEAVNQAALSFNTEKSQMDVMCLDDPSAPWVVKTNSYIIHALGEGKTAYGFHFSYFNWLRKNAKNYDVVIIDGLWQFLVVGGYFLKLVKVPYCLFIHGMLSPYFNKNKLKYIKKIPFWFLVERNVIAMANAVIFTCEEEKRLAVNSLPFYRGNSVIATHGVEGTVEESSILAENFLTVFKSLKDKKIILYLSRIHEIKGIDLLVDALGKIKNIPDDVVLAIAGPDSNGLKAKLTIQIEKQSLSNRVMWLGMLRGNLKWGAYHAADVFVLPSHQENFGIVVAEALSTATPVLITNKVNIWHEINEVSAGFVENDDVAGIEDLLNRWLALSNTEKTDMSVRAEACYEANFSIKSAMVDLENIFVSVIK
jgi:glycosyltransferase involved in cell wall biosynthesis